MVFWWSDCNVILFKCNQWFRKKISFFSTVFFTNPKEKHILVFWWREFLNAFFSKGRKSTLFWSAAAIVTKIYFNSSWLVKILFEKLFLEKPFYSFIKVIFQSSVEYSSLYSHPNEAESTLIQLSCTLWNLCVCVVCYLIPFSNGNLKVV